MRSQFYTAKELSDIVELNERHVRRSDTQRRLGIDQCRDTTCSRPIRWHRRAANQALRQRNFQVQDPE